MLVVVAWQSGVDGVLYMWRVIYAVIIGHCLQHLVTISFEGNQWLTNNIHCIISPKYVCVCLVIVHFIY